MRPSSSRSRSSGWIRRQPRRVRRTRRSTTSTLRVTSPDSTDYLGNDFTNGVSTPNGTTADNVNNVEMVVVNNPVTGKWQLEVLGVINVGNPGQGYALVATANMQAQAASSPPPSTATATIRTSS